MTAASRIYDSGYRRYDGARLGPAHAFRAVVTHTLQRVFGLHRPARTKVLPILATAIAYVPAAVFVGLAAFLPRQLSENALPTYGDFYGFITAAVLLFVVFVAPEAMCPDRRSGVLSLYLAAPLTRSRYLAAKATAIFIALLFVTLGPPLLLLVGLSLQNSGPKGPAGLALILLRIVGSGAMLAAFFSALSVAASSLTDRRAVASAGTFGFVFAVNAVTAVLVFGAKAPDWVLALSPSRGPFELTRRIHGEPPLQDFHAGTAALAGAALAWFLIGAALAWHRYRSLQVTR
ncbi:MAG: ABC transporter permease [Actinobacteria bacterium]|nr:ABC transporter permease [Actinomycetota bacterium]